MLLSGLPFMMEVVACVLTGTKFQGPISKVAQQSKSPLDDNKGKAIWTCGDKVSLI